MPWKPHCDDTMAGDGYDCLKLENQLCFPMYVCAKEIVKKYRPFLDPLGITYTQYIALLVLWEKDAVSMKDLGDRMFLDSGTLTPLLRKLEEKGYVSRTRDPADERSVVVTLTPEGKNLREKAVDIPASVGACMNISEEDAVALYGILGRLMVTFADNQ